MTVSCILGVGPYLVGGPGRPPRLPASRAGPAEDRTHHTDWAVVICGLGLQSPNHPRLLSYRARRTAQCSRTIIVSVSAECMYIVKDSCLPQESRHQRFIAFVFSSKSEWKRSSFTSTTTGALLICWCVFIYLNYPRGQSQRGGDLNTETLNGEGV